MTLRRPLVAVGSAVSTLLLVGAIVIEALTAATGADIGPGIVGVGVGALAALGSLVLVAWRWPHVGSMTQSLLSGYAAFGFAFLFLSALSYVNVPGARTVLSVPLNAGLAAVAAIAVAAVAWRADGPAG